MVLSRALVCDQCGSALSLNAKGEHEYGEDAAWLKISTGAYATAWDVCSRSCAVELIDNGVVASVVDAELQSIAEIVRAIHGEGDAA
jgi:hypothetical protein